MNGVTNPALNEYAQVKNAQVVNNTFVNCDYALRIGTSLSGTEEPVNLTVANNIMYNTSINAYQINTTPTGTSLSEGNITNLSNSDIADDGNFHRITSASVAVDANIGSYSFLSDDILRGSRDANVDAGAEEFGANGTSLPYKSQDVGTKIGFLSGSDKLSTSVNTIDFNIVAGTKSFEINSNVTWTISENVDWLSVNSTNGSNNATIEITANENTSGASRTGTITVSENGGDLSATITVNQSTETFNTDNAISLTGITVTAVGTQVGDNIPENTLDDDENTRWSANSSDGSAYLTYDLQCKKIVTSVKIYFHKGEQRTSSFKIATSNDGTNFTDATTVLTSSGNTVGFEDIPLSPFQEVRYVRILGFGNSENSGWNSYEEVQIFGDDACASLSLDDNNFRENKFTFYPNPAKNILNIVSKNPIGFVEIYNIRGQKIINQKIEENTGIIETKSLAKGIYLIKINGTLSKFIVE